MIIQLHKLMVLLEIVVVIFINKGCCSTTKPFQSPLPNNYEIFASSVDWVRLLSNNKSEVEIPPKVVEIAWDDRYIIVKQMELAFYDRNGKKIAEGSDFVETKLHENVIYYWIVDTLENNKYGPFRTKIELKEEQKKFKIENLELKPVDFYKNLRDRGW